MIQLFSIACLEQQFALCVGAHRGAKSLTEIVAVLNYQLAQLTCQDTYLERVRRGTPALIDTDRLADGANVSDSSSLSWALCV
jgi:hypothetical protein